MQNQHFNKLQEEGKAKDRMIQSLQDKLKAAENRPGAPAPAKGQGAASAPGSIGTGDGVAFAGSLSSLVPTALVKPPVSLPEFHHPTFKIQLVAQDKAMSKALEAAGIKLEGTLIQVVPKASVAAQRVQDLADGLEKLQSTLGPEDPAILGLRKELEAERQRAGPHAQLKDGKQLTDALY